MGSLEREDEHGPPRSGEFGKGGPSGRHPGPWMRLQLFHHPAARPTAQGLVMLLCFPAYWVPLGTVQQQLSDWTRGKYGRELLHFFSNLQR